MEIDLESVGRLSRDLASAARTLTIDEARFFVNAYYMMQDNRKRTDNQSGSMSKQGKPHDLMTWLSGQNLLLENQVKRALDKYSASHPLGAWARDIKGIGPVLAAGLLAHIDVAKVPTAGAVWRFAGLDSTVKWESSENTLKWVQKELATSSLDEVLEKACLYFGRRADTLRRYACFDKEGNTRPLTATSLARSIARRPWNGDLKVLCWKIGESFVKVSGHDDAVYGKIYLARRVLEDQKNQAGEYAQQAASILDRFNYGKDTEAYAAYSQGKLPKAHLYERAKRYAVKIFLSHFHQVGRELAGLPIVKPFAIEHLGHAHMIDPPR